MSFSVFDLYATIGIKLDDFERGLDQAKKKAETFASNLKGISTNIDKAYSGLGDLLSPAVDGFKAVESVGQKAGSAISTSLKSFAAASTVVAGFGTAAVNSGMQFDSTMSKVAATVGWTTDELSDKTSDASDEFAKLRDKALEMGATTQFSASEAADALTYMAMAGWKTDDMLGGIKGIMDLAAASGEDLASTSDIVTDALTAFGMSASESGHFADILAKASSNSNTNVSLMGETFKYVAPVAGALGYSAEDTAVAIGLMANSGIKASQAGTALRTTLTNMAKPTDSMATAMAALGVSLEDGNGKMYSLSEVMDQLRDGFGTGAMSAAEFREKFSELNEGLESGKYTQESYDSTLQDLIVSMYGAEGAQKAELAAMLAGKEGMSGLLAIVSAAPDDYEKLRDAIYGCNGAAEQMAATMMDNLAGDIKYLQSAFESLQIAISDSLTPTLREFAQFGQKAMANLLEGFQGGGMFGFASALTDVVSEGISMLSEKAPDFVWVSTNIIMAVANGILDGKDQIISAGTEIVNYLFSVFDEWISNSEPDLIAFGTDIINLIFNGFSQAGEVISEHIGAFIPLIANAFLSYHETLFTIGLDILGAIGQGIIENKEELQSMASETIANMVTALRDNAPMIIEGGIALLEALVGAIMENMPLILETGAEIIGQLVAGISTSMPALIVAVGAILPQIAKVIDVVENIGGAVKHAAKLAGEGIEFVRGIGGQLMTGIKALFSLIMAHPVIAVVTAIIAAVVLLWNNCEEFRDFVKGMVEAVIGFFSSLAEGVAAAVEGVAEFIGGVFSAAWDLIESVWEGAVSFFQSVWSGIQDVFSVVADVLGGFFSAASEAVQSAWEDAKQFFSDVADGIRTAFEAVTSFLGEVFSAAWSVISGVWDAAVGFFSDIWDGISSAGQAAAEAVGDALSAAWNAITSVWDGAVSFFGGIWDGIKGVFADVWSHFLDIGGNILAGLKTGIENGFSSFINWLGKKILAIPNFVMELLGINSPSKVFAGIGENMALGLAEGWDDEYRSIKRQIENGLNFGTATVGLNASGDFKRSEAMQNNAQNSFGGGSNMTVNIYSPTAVDAVTAAREWKKTAQRMTMSYV